MSVRNVVLVSLLAVTAAVVTRKFLFEEKKKVTPNSDRSTPYDLDAMDDDSFPASDPPSWSGGHYH
ncbi:hypothetical protein [Bdellovibrio sp. GT3]|uniref:hypothetical protein n=1 Tax=unclassified Bdellovibrio TaxID=2633795 RepID=UPI0030F1B640